MTAADRARTPARVPRWPEAAAEEPDFAAIRAEFDVPEEFPPGVRAEAELRVTDRIERCVMVTRPQAGGIERDTGVLKTIHREREGRLAVGALVTRPGAVATGDAVTVLD